MLYNRLKSRERRQNVSKKNMRKRCTRRNSKENTKLGRQPGWKNRERGQPNKLKEYTIKLSVSLERKLPVWRGNV